VYPGALPSPSVIDPRGLKPGWQNEAGQQGDRDLKLFDAILATMHQKFSVDDKRIYSTGFSNGGGFSYVLWAERARSSLRSANVRAGCFPPSTPLNRVRFCDCRAGRYNRSLRLANSSRSKLIAR